MYGVIIDVMKPVDGCGKAVIKLFRLPRMSII